MNLSLLLQSLDVNFSSSSVLQTWIRPGVSFVTVATHVLGPWRGDKGASENHSLEPTACPYMSLAIFLCLVPRESPVVSSTCNK